MRSPFYSVWILEKLERILKFSFVKVAIQGMKLGLKMSLPTDGAMNLKKIAPKPPTIKVRAHKSLSTDHWSP